MTSRLDVVADWGRGVFGLGGQSEKKDSDNGNSSSVNSKVGRCVQVLTADSKKKESQQSKSFKGYLAAKAKTLFKCVLVVGLLAAVVALYLVLEVIRTCLFILGICLIAGFALKYLCGHQ